MRVESTQLHFEARRDYTEQRRLHEHIRLDPRPTPALVSAETRLGVPAEDYFDSADPRLLYTWLVVEALLGGTMSPASSALRRPSGNTAIAPVAAGASRPGLTVTHHKLYEENESLVVSAAGNIQTTDGRSIAFDAEFILARSFRLESTSTIRSGEPPVSDPLFLDTGNGQLLRVRDSDSDGEVTSSEELFGARARAMASASSPN